MHDSSKDTGNVIWTAHADDRLRQRKLTKPMALQVLRSGRLVGAPEPDIKHRGVKCQMQQFVAGVTIRVVVSVDYPEPDLVVVTVIDVKA